VERLIGNRVKLTGRPSRRRTTLLEIGGYAFMIAALGVLVGVAYKNSEEASKLKAEIEPILISQGSIVEQEMREAILYTIVQAGVASKSSWVSEAKKWRDMTYEDFKGRQSPLKKFAVSEENSTRIIELSALSASLASLRESMLDYVNKVMGGVWAGVKAIIFVAIVAILDCYAFPRIVFSTELWNLIAVVGLLAAVYLFSWLASFLSPGILSFQKNRSLQQKLDELKRTTNLDEMKEILDEVLDIVG